MEISIFDILGPVMVGPSSSHTAGAARLARAAAEIAGKPFEKVTFGLSGSFAKTCKGHGTDKALLAGALGAAPDDEWIPDAMEIARQRGISAHFYSEELDDMHENSAHITFHHAGGAKSEVWGSSTGGGRILISRIGEYETKLLAERPTLIVNHLDRPGVIGDVSQLLAKHNINIGVLRLSRLGRGKKASAMFIVDEPIPPDVAQAVRGLPHVEEVVILDVP